ncbi:hypothetical protein [Streptomyces acidicola]|uniref:Uncharacterized protein n=1 Tax=Streptomyces acidicola TaxID=2596892 RepID=A0A5N8X7P7_9ACTN|nr:hypothetical protein [Streptomyces acidicola]MPY55186.1 hypothetical protein [Streptomyces acidicola]
MQAETVIAVAATVIALGSLWVSHTQSNATRLHNRQSVRPILQIRRIHERRNRRVGLQVINAGLGPAVVTDTEVRLDGVVVGKWDRTVKDRIFSPTDWPSTYSLRKGAVVLNGEQTFLVRFDSDDPDRLERFWDIVGRRLVIDIHYESVYGGEGFTVSSLPQE